MQPTIKPTGHHLRRPARSLSISWNAGVSPSARSLWKFQKRCATARATEHANKDPQRDRHAISALGRRSHPQHVLELSPGGTRTSVFLVTIVPPSPQPAQPTAPPHQFQSPGISCVVHIQIEVSHEDVGCNPPASFPTNPCRHTLHCVSPSAKNPSTCARCAVMAKSIK